MSMRSLIKKILKEQDEFDWIREVSFDGGEYFQDRDICFGDRKTCDVNINDEHYHFSVGWDDFIDKFLDIGDYNSYYLSSVIYGSDYSYDYDYMDSDEFNYINPSDTIINRLNELTQRLGLNDYNVQTDIDEQALLNLGLEITSKGLTEIRTLFESLVDEAVNEIENAVTRNRWDSLQVYYDNLLNDEMSGIDIDKSGGFVDVTIPLEMVHKLMGEGADDLTKLLTIACEPLSKEWSDYYYEDFDTSGSGEEIDRLFLQFIDRANNLLDTTDILENSKILTNILEEVGAEYDKWPSGQWQITPGGGSKNYTIKINNINNRTGTLNAWKAQGYKQLTRPEKMFYTELPKYVKNNL